LESRELLSSTSGLIHGFGVREVHDRVREVHPDFFTIPHGPPTSPRIGGAAALVGSVLLVVVNKPGNFLNETTIQDDGAGNVTVEWNGHNPPTFHGVSRIVIDARGRSNVVNYTLTGNVTVPHEVDVRLDGTNSNFTQTLTGHTNGELLFQLQTAPPPDEPGEGTVNQLDRSPAGTALGNLLDDRKRATPPAIS